MTEYLYRLPSRRFVRVRHRYNLTLGQTFTPVSKRLSDEEAAEWLLAGGFDLPDDIVHLAEKYRFSEVPAPQLQDGLLVDSVEVVSSDVPEPDTTELLLEPSETLQKLYHDPDNYRRSIWLYEQKKSG